jgi:Tol biopolymer transport system component
MSEGRSRPNDLTRRLRDIEGFAPPDLWEEIIDPGPRPSSSEPGPARRPLAAALALLLGLVGVVLVVRAFGGHEQQTEPATPVDNGLIAFVSEVPSDLYEGATQGEIFAMNPDGTGRIRLTRDPGAFDEDPAWSPDGTRIAFVKLGDLASPGIYVMNADGSGPRWILEDSTGPTSPSWSPDGTSIVFESGLGEERTGSGDRDVFVAEVATGELRRLTSDPARDEYPALSPDGSRIAFTRQSRGDADIYVMNVDGSSVTQLTSGHGVDLRPAWSPDGRQIVFERDGDVYVANADGSDLTNLTEGPAEDRDPVWAPDGTWVGFVRDGDIYVIDPDGGSISRLTTDGAGYSGLAWQALGSP